MKHVHSKKLVFEYSRITEYIYVGTNQCCQMHFSKALIKKGIRADVSLEEKRLDQPFGVNYYLWLPVKNHSAPSLKRLLIGANFIKQLVDNKIKTYVHCKNGHGRAPTLIAAYLILQGMGLKEAISLIKKKRPSMHLHELQIIALRKFGGMKNGKRI